MDYTLYGTTYGLALSSGINAYFPLLAFAIATRWFHLYKVNPHFSFITQTWFIALLAVLTLIDFFADKIPLIDHTWDAIHTFVRPVTGALVAAASYNQVHLQSMMATMTKLAVTISALTGATSMSISASLLGVMLLGAALAFMAHITKATTRIASTATTAGLGNIVLSFIENAGVIIMTLLSLFVPFIMFVFILLFVLVFIASFRRIIRLFGR